MNASRTAGSGCHSPDPAAIIQNFQWRGKVNRWKNAEEPKRAERIAALEKARTPADERQPIPNCSTVKEALAGLPFLDGIKGEDHSRTFIKLGQHPAVIIGITDAEYISDTMYDAVFSSALAKSCHLFLEKVTRPLADYHRERASKFLDLAAVDGHIHPLCDNRESTIDLLAIAAPALFKLTSGPVAQRIKDRIIRQLFMHTEALDLMNEAAGNLREGSRQAEFMLHLGFALFRTRFPGELIKISDSTRRESWYTNNRSWVLFCQSLVQSAIEENIVNKNVKAALTEFVLHPEVPKCQLTYERAHADALVTSTVEKIHKILAHDPTEKNSPPVVVIAEKSHVGALAQRLHVGPYTPFKKPAEGKKAEKTERKDAKTAK